MGGEEEDDDCLHQNLCDFSFFFYLLHCSSPSPLSILPKATVEVSASTLQYGTVLGREGREHREHEEKE